MERKTSFDYTMSQAESTMKNEGDELSKGYMVSEHIGWEWKWKKQLKGTLRGCLGYFSYFRFRLPYLCL